MTWFKIDDKHWSDEKILALRATREGRAAQGDWLSAGCWAAQHGTDGLVPAAALRVLRIGHGSVTRLVQAGLWLGTDSGYQFVNWARYQPVKDEESYLARSSHPARPGPARPDHQPSVDNARELRAAFAGRFERARGMTWPSGKYHRETGELAAWLRANPTVEQDEMLDNFFRDEWAASTGYPFGALAKAPDKYAAPPKPKDPEAEARQRRADRERRKKETEIEMGVRKPGDFS